MARASPLLQQTLGAQRSKGGLTEECLIVNGGKSTAGRHTYNLICW